jgi:DNA-binding CsgD family transcriptional regulator
MPTDQDEFDRLILDIHSAPLDPAQWPRVVDRIGRLVAAERGLLFAVPQRAGEEFWHAAANMDPRCLNDYAMEFAPEDTWMLAHRARRTPLVAGGVSTGEELVDRSQFLRSRFYNEFLNRYDIDRFLNLTLRPGPPGAAATATLSLYRGSGNEAFGEAERTTLARVAPHLVRALATFWTLKGLRVQQAALAHSLDALSIELFLIDRHGYVMFANAAAESALTKGKCLKVDNRCLVASNSVRNPKACSSVLRGLLCGRAQSAWLEFDTGDRMLLSAAPCPDATEVFAPWAGAAGLVWLTPTPHSEAGVSRVASLFSLTAAERALLAQLANGVTLSDAAVALQISIHTARTQLKAIQYKTGWHSQTELVRMLAQLGVIRNE